MQSLHSFKYHDCARCQGEGILLVDVESEAIPHTDGRGHWLYYCTEGHHVFSVKGPGKARIDQEQPDRQHAIPGSDRQKQNV